MTLLALAVLCTGSVTAWADSDRRVYSENGHSYQRIDTPQLNWHDARAHCDGLGAYLATVTSDGENEFLRVEIGSGDVWLGGTDARVEGLWEWITGEPWTYSRWHPGEPNNLYPEHYLMMYGRGTWNDARGVDPRSFVCEWDWLGFAAFDPERVIVTFDVHPASLDAFAVRGTFALGEGSDGVDLLNEDVRVEVGPAVVTIPGGSLEIGEDGRFYWQGTVEGVQVDVAFEELGVGQMGYSIDVSDVDLEGLSNPTTVVLTVGNDAGEAVRRLAGTISADGEHATTP